MSKHPRNDPSIHKGHRQRLRNRYKASGFESFSSHEILEYLLCYVIPRQDVNPLAHQLLNRFGSLANVLDASCEELQNVDGMGPTSAQFLHMLPELARIYLMNKQLSSRSFNRASDIKKFLQPLFVGATEERLLLMLFDNRMHMLYFDFIAHGSHANVYSSYREIATLVIRHNASAVIIAHNHPQGLAFSSPDDQSATVRLADFLLPLNVVLLEHFLVTEHFCVPIFSHKNSSTASCAESVLKTNFFHDLSCEHSTYAEICHDIFPESFENDIVEQFFPSSTPTNDKK